MSDNLFVGVGLITTDIIGANATSAYLDMKTFDSAMFVVTLASTWEAAETLDTCKLVQATTAGGAGVKDIALKAVTAEDPSAAGETYVLECDAIELDIANSFYFVACYVANLGAAVDASLTIIKVGYNNRKKYSNFIGATARI